MDAGAVIGGGGGRGGERERERERGRDPLRRRERRRRRTKERIPLCKKRRGDQPTARKKGDCVRQKKTFKKGGGITLGGLAFFTPSFSCSHVSDKKNLRSISSSNLHSLSFESFCLDSPSPFPPTTPVPSIRNKPLDPKSRKKATKPRGGGGKMFPPPSPAASDTLNSVSFLSHSHSGQTYYSEVP